METIELSWLQNESVVNTLTLVVILILARFVIVRAIKGQMATLSGARRRWLSVVQNTSFLLGVLGLIYIWSPELSTFALSLTAFAAFLSHLLQRLGDEWMVIYAMHYRWNHDGETTFAEFGRSMRPDASPAEQYETGKARGTPFRAMLPALGIVPDTIPGIERSYLRLLDLLDAHFAATPFLLGNQPTLADFGFIGPLYAHLYRDPNSGALMKRHAPRVADWVERMTSSEWSDAPEFAPSGLDGLRPVVAHLLGEYIPVLRETARLFDAGRRRSPAELPCPAASALCLSAWAVRTGERWRGLSRYCGCNRRGNAADREHHGGWPLSGKA